MLSSDSSDVELSEGESVPMILELHERQQEWRTEYRKDPLVCEWIFNSSTYVLFLGQFVLFSMSDGVNEVGYLIRPGVDLQDCCNATC